MVSLMSVNHINLIADGNNNGTGRVRIMDGNYDVDSATAVADFSPEYIYFQSPITASGNISASGDIIVTGDLQISGSGNIYGSSSYLNIANDGTAPSELRLNCEANSHYIGIRGPVHAGASSYVLKLPNDAPSDNQI